MHVVKAQKDNQSFVSSFYHPHPYFACLRRTSFIFFNLVSLKSLFDSSLSIAMINLFANDCSITTKAKRRKRSAPGKCVEHGHHWQYTVLFYVNRTIWKSRVNRTPWEFFCFLMIFPRGSPWKFFALWRFYKYLMQTVRTVYTRKDCTICARHVHAIRCHANKRMQIATAMTIQYALWIARCSRSITAQHQTSHLVPANHTFHHPLQ